MNARLIAIAVVFAAGGCAAWRLWGEIPVSAGPAAAGIPYAPEERRKAALFYSDLGPDSIDLAGYPAGKKREYAVYARVCARCHTLARSINAPYVDRSWWEFYIASMRMRSSFHGEPLGKKDVKAVLDFLDYDANLRKVGRAEEFDALKAELKRRFEAALDERMEQLQKNPLPKT